MITKDIAKYLDAQGIGVFDEVGTSGDIFIQRYPAEPINCISINNIVGGEPHETLDDITYNIQILVRNTMYINGHNKIWQIFNLLDKPDNRIILINNKKVKAKAIQTPFIIESSEKSFLFGFNIMFWSNRT